MFSGLGPKFNSKDNLQDQFDLVSYKHCKLNLSPNPELTISSIVTYKVVYCSKRVQSPNLLFHGFVNLGVYCNENHLRRNKVMRWYDSCIENFMSVRLYLCFLDSLAAMLYHQLDSLLCDFNLLLYFIAPNLLVSRFYLISIWFENCE